jgi:hypothetical protein
VTLRTGFLRRDLLFRIALGAFASSSLLRIFVHPAGRAAQDWLDGAHGLSVGLLIGALGLAVWQKRTCARC